MNLTLTCGHTGQLLHCFNHLLHVIQWLSSKWRFDYLDWTLQHFKHQLEFVLLSSLPWERQRNWFRHLHTGWQLGSFHDRDDSRRFSSSAGNLTSNSRTSTDTKQHWNWSLVSFQLWRFNCFQPFQVPTLRSSPLHCFHFSRTLNSICQMIVHCNKNEF